jgi:hypothetical protein
MKRSPIVIPTIHIEIQPVWEDFVTRYQSSKVVVSGGLKFTETFWYLAHTRNNSILLHSVSSHLYAEIGNFKLDDSYRLLKSVVLEGFFSLRESLARLVNVVYNLQEVAPKAGASRKILEKVKESKLTVEDYLCEIIPPDSRLGKYLEKYRHPYVHREDLSGFTVQDIVLAMVGKEQPRVTEFITNSYETSRWMQKIESNIAQECMKHLKIS